MEARLLSIAIKFWPGLENLGRLERTEGIGDVIGYLYSAPLALAGLVWLVLVTDMGVVRVAWPVLLLLLALHFLFDRLDFYFFLPVPQATDALWGDSLWSVISWSGVLMFGPTALWLTVCWELISRAQQWFRSRSTVAHWSLARNHTFNLARMTLTPLVALAFYRRWGGAFPFPRLTLDAVLPALYATFAWWLLWVLLWMPAMLFFLRLFTSAGGAVGTYARYVAIGMSWHALATPFAILAAGLYAQNGLGGYLFFVAGLLLASLLAHQLSRAAERSQQRSRELERLERLGRAILDAPPDASTLPDILKEHVSTMFPRGQIEIRLFPERTILHHPTGVPTGPDDWPPVGAATWEWLRTAAEARCFLPGALRPWGEQPNNDGVVVAPILDVENATPVGGVYLAQRRQARAILYLLPAAQSLAAQIGSALHRAQTYAQTLAHQRVEHELALAGQIQASFLPTALPSISGWQLAATLKPARETCGDFYDVVPLPNGRFGILIADVADKGMGAALYMALSRTLIRTYAMQYHTRPDYVLRVANRRILMDADPDASMFVTVFYGVLDPVSGTLTYCNAGHNPPYLLSAPHGDTVRLLGKTGMALGVVENTTWEQAAVPMATGDVLVLYTDGVTDAENEQGTFFGQERLLEVLRTNQEHPAQDIQDTLITHIHDFVGHAPQFDDIALMVVAREA
jgi:serine phosphatase RsbU (regulator of sigma subunit)